MKRITLLLLCLVWLFPFVLQAQTATQPEGSGTASDPYQISSLNNLFWVTQNGSSWDKNFIQTQDINAADTKNWHTTNYGNIYGYPPIGDYDTAFSGSYNGQNHIIDSLFIYGGIRVGLFGHVMGGNISNVGVTHVDITAQSWNAGIVGILYSGKINNCFSTGVVNHVGSSKYTGGLAGENYGGIITNSYSTCDVTGGEYVGGLVGLNNDNAQIIQCYSTGNVNGEQEVGGLIGNMWGYSLIRDSYTRGNVTSIGTNNLMFGGFAGASGSSTIQNCYATGSVYVEDYTDKGFVDQFGNMSYISNFFDSTASNQTSGYGATALTTAQMKTETTFTGAGWDFSSTWSINDTNNDGYPHLQMLDIPILKTNDVFNIGIDTAQSGGSFIIESNSAITAKGVVWDKNGYPTLTNNLGSTNDGSGSGSFTSTLTGLSDTTVYYVRAYATNSNGTGYGPLKSFITKMTPPPTMNPPGNALNFEGDSGYVRLPYQNTFNFSGTMTVEAWIKVNSFDKKWQAIVTKGNNSWSLQRYDTTNFIDFFTIYGGNPRHLEGTTNVNDGEWHFISAVYDPSGGYKYLYVDGNLEASDFISNGMISADDAPVEIGANADDTSRNFNGLIDEVRIWSVARSADEINSEMNIVLTGHENGLVAYHKFDMSAGTYLYDHTGNGNTGKLHNLDNSDWIASGWPAQSEPIVSTSDVFDIGRDTAMSGGNVTYCGTTTLTARGLVWGTMEMPTLNNCLGKSIESGGCGSFTSKITGLSDSTLYYVRAYAVNSGDTAYGEPKYFITLMLPPAAMTPPGNALNFKGDTGYVFLQNDTSFNFTTTMTVEAWIKVDAFNKNWQAIVTKGNNSWRLQRYKNTNFIDFGTTGLYVVDIKGKTNVNDGQWHFIAGVYDGDKKYLYVDGNLDATASIFLGSKSIAVSNARVEIGANSESPGTNFDGLIDEVRLWNVARTSDEIISDMYQELEGSETGLVAYYKFNMSEGNYLYDHSGNGEMGKLQNMQDSVWVPSGWTVAYDPVVNTNDIINIGADTAQVNSSVVFQGESPLIVKGVVWDTTDNPVITDYLGKTSDGDSIGSYTSTLTGLSDTTLYYVRAYATNNHGTGYGEVKSFSTQMSEPPAMTPPGNALNFEGDSGYVLLSNEYNFDFTNAMTVAAWIKVNSFTTDWQAILSKGGDGSWRLQRYGNTNYIDFGTSGLSNQDLKGSTNVNDGNWHYIAGVLDGSTKYLYVDGNLDASVSVTSFISTTNEGVEIGANSEHPDRNFDGLIDEVRIWNVARTQTEINNNMYNVLTGTESGLVAYYKFDDSSGTYLYDYTGNNNLGKLHNMSNSDWVSSGWPYHPEPLLYTMDAFNIGRDTAQSGGIISSQGSSSITLKGVVWDITDNPTITSHLGITDEGSGSDSFTSTLTGLSDTTVYYVRAYAANSTDTGYGEVKTFYTQMVAPPSMTPPGNALDFDGTDDYVSIPNESNFDFTNAMTVAAWIKVNSFTVDWQAIVTKGDGSWRLQRYGSTNHIDFGMATDLFNTDLEGTTDVADGNWHYIAGVFDGSATYLYVDGNLDSWISITGTISTTDDQVEIAANSNGPPRNFDGQIDEVRIWNVARTQTQLNDNMNIVLEGNENGLVAYYKFNMSSGTYLYDHTGNGNLGKLHNMTNSDWIASGWPAQTEPGLNTKDAFNIGADTAQSGGIITYEGTSPIIAKGVVWDTASDPTLTNHLGITDEGGGIDSFTSTLTGLSDTTLYYFRAYATNSNGTGYGDVKSFTTQMSPPPAMIPPGNALDFDGTDDYVSLPNEQNFDFTSAMTVAAWIKVNSFTVDWQAIVTKGDGSWRLQRYASSNHIDFGTSGLSNGDLEGTTDVADGNWHYIAGVFDGLNKYLYVDGNLDASASATGTIFTTNEPVEIAANSEHPGRNFDGLIDEVRIWNVARTQSELINNMNNVLAGTESGLVAYYKFDVSSGTVLYDHSGNNNIGILHNMNNSDWVPSGWPVQTEPTVSTKDAFNIGADTAQSGGIILADGGSPITAKGVVWDITDNPNITSHLGITDEGGGSDSFTSTLTGLSDTTVYYVRAYAINSNGTGYGEVKSFTTQMSPPPAMTPPGNALDFDGTDDYVLLPNESDFDFTTAMTVAAWIKVNSFTESWQAIITKGDGSWRLQRYWSTNHIDFGTSGLSNQDLEGTTNVADGNWHYIAGVFDGSAKYLYVDGNLDTSVVVSGTIAITDSAVQIGANSDVSGRNFDGQIDEVRIWNVARTQTELNDNMNIVLTGNESGLVAYYKFDVSSGTYLYDHTGNNNIGRLHNMTNSDWVASGWPVQLEPIVNTKDAFNIGSNTAQSGGIITSVGCSPITAKGVVWDITNDPTVTSYLGITDEGGGADSFTSTLTGLSDTTVYYVRAYATNSYGTAYGDVKSFTTKMSPTLAGNALEFDGTDDYVSIPNESDYDFTTSMTVEVWIKVNAFDKYWQAVITKGDDAWRLHRYLSTDNIAFGTSGLSNVDLQGSTNVNDGQWHHVAAVFDGSHKYLYVDGKLDASAAVTGTISLNDIPVNIAENGGNSGRYFNGKIDEVRIWSAALDSTQIRENMNLPLTGSETGLVSYWQFNDGSGNVLTDLVSGNNGTLHNMTDDEWVISTIPFGPGYADTETEEAGTVAFTNTGLSMNFTLQNSASITVTRIDTTANTNPAEPDVVFDKQYWVVNRYGSGSFNADLTFTISEDLTGADESDPGNISLFTRGSTADTSWALLASATSVNAANNTATFTGITGFSQFIIARMQKNIELDLTVFLEGPYNGTNMVTDLNPGEIPLAQPYNVAPWNYTGTESVISIPTNVVDWVLIELRDTTDASKATGETMIARQAAFLLNNGKIVNTAGTNARPCFSTTVSNNLFVVIWHRNHLAVMSANPVTETGGIYTYDFTTSANQAFGTNAQKDLGGGVYGMISADANADGNINTDDKTIWENQAGEQGYKSADFDMDGQVNNIDKDDKWVPNEGEGGQVPQ